MSIYQSKRCAVKRRNFRNKWENVLGSNAEWKPVYTEDLRGDDQEANIEMYMLCEFISNDLMQCGTMIPLEGDKISYTWGEFKDNTEDYDHERDTGLLRRVKF